VVTPTAAGKESGCHRYGTSGQEATLAWQETAFSQSRKYFDEVAGFLADAEAAL
jgi:hypothetical protein